VAFRVCDGFQDDPVLLFDPGRPLRPTLRAIPPPLAPFLAGAAPLLEEAPGAGLVGKRSRGHASDQSSSQGIDSPVAFAALDCLPVGTPSVCPPHLGRLHRLPLQTPRRGLFVPRLFGADAGASRLGDSDPHPLELPGSHIMRDALPLGKIDWPHAPWAPAFGHSKDGMEHGAPPQGARSSTAFGGGDHLFAPLPFLVGQVAWIYCFVHIPILHNQRRLFRQALRETNPGIVLTSATISWFNTFSFARSACGFTCERRR
jgi:hypothetical protein